MNGVVKNISALSIQTTGQLPSLSKGQKQLLEQIRFCVKENIPFTFEMMLNIYYFNVRKKFQRGEGWHYPDGDYRFGRYSYYVEYDILECWKKQERVWCFKPNVRQWFLSNIGILVLKNQLVIIPTIDLGEDQENG